MLDVFKNNLDLILCQILFKALYMYYFIYFLSQLCDRYHYNLNFIHEDTEAQTFKYISHSHNISKSYNWTSNPTQVVEVS